MSATKIIIAISLLTIVFIGAAGFGGYYLLRGLIPFDLSPREIPSELAEARVLKGGDLITRSDLYKLDRSSLVDSATTDILKSEKDRVRSSGSNTAIGIYNFTDVEIVGRQLVAAGPFGAYFFDSQGSFVRSITFEPIAQDLKIGSIKRSKLENPNDAIQIIDLGAHRVGFFSHGPTSGVNVFDENGENIFSQGKESVDLGNLLKSNDENYKDFDESKYVTSAAVGDLDRDGIADVVVARNGDGIRAYSLAGQELWAIPYESNAYSLVIKDLDGDGKNELIDIGKSVFNANGTLKRTFDTRLYDSILFDKSNTGEVVIQAITHSDGMFKIEREDGEITFSAPAPLSEVMAKPWGILSSDRSNPDRELELESIHRPHAVWLKLFKDKPKVLAVVGNFIGMPRSNLYVYEKSGKLLYHELLDEEAETIAAMPNSDGTESIVVGGMLTLWKFTAN